MRVCTILRFILEMTLRSESGLMLKYQAENECDHIPPYNVSNNTLWGNSRCGVSELEETINK